MTQRAGVIFDLCGTLAGDDGDIRNLELYPGCVPALRLLAEAGIPAAIVTNQSGIARGRFSQHDFDNAVRRLADQLSTQSVALPPVYCCPHTAKCGCACRKPAPGLAQRAAADLGLDLSRSAVIGDSGADDMLLARAIGAKAVLVLTGWGKGSLGEYRRLWAHTQADHVADDAAQAVSWVLGQVQTSRA